MPLTVFNNKNNKDVADLKNGKFSPTFKQKFPNVTCFRCYKTPLHSLLCQVSWSRTF